MIVSFAYTTEALLRGKKTVTRRNWKASHAQRFQRIHVEERKVVKAYSNLPIQGGVHVANLRVLSMRREALGLLLNDLEYAREEMRKEGDLWDTVFDFIGVFGEDFDPSRELYRIEFVVLELVRPATWRSV